MRTATKICKAKNMSGDAALYKLSEPLDGNEYVIVSAVDLASRFQSIRAHDWDATETYIFPANEAGRVTSWGELDGSQKGTLDHSVALRDAGYEVAA